MKNNLLHLAVGGLALSGAGTQAKLKEHSDPLKSTDIFSRRPPMADLLKPTLACDGQASSSPFCVMKTPVSRPPVIATTVGASVTNKMCEEFVDPSTQIAVQNPDGSGIIRPTREQLGLKESDVLILDIGGEGEKTQGDLKTGNRHAVNVNAQTNVSPGQFKMPTAGLSSFPMSPDVKRPIPQLVRPAETWSRDGSTEYPFAERSADGLIAQGIPMNDKSREEMLKVLSDQGWALISFDEKSAQKLANAHNGGVMFPVGENGVNYLIPPKIAVEENWLHDNHSAHNLPALTSHDFNRLLDDYRNSGVCPKNSDLPSA